MSRYGANNMKYNELSVGDVFTINREKNDVVYIKDQFWFQECNGGKKHRPLNGCTQVTKIGELIK